MLVYLRIRIKDFRLAVVVEKGYQKNSTFLQFNLLKLILEWITLINHS